MNHYNLLILDIDNLNCYYVGSSALHVVGFYYIVLDFIIKNLFIKLDLYYQKVIGNLKILKEGVIPIAVLKEESNVDRLLHCI